MFLLFFYLKKSSTFAAKLNRYKMYFTGIIIAIMTFLTIGIWHPIVIKTEYHWGTRPWIIYLLVGLACCGTALFILRCVRSFSTLGHRRTVSPEETRGERLVPQESQAPVLIISDE